MKIITDRLLINAFLVSFAGHCLFLGAPRFYSSRKTHEPKETIITLKIEKPALLPKIDTLAKEKKLKEIKHAEQKHQTKTEEQPSIPKELPEQKIKAVDPAKEAMLRYQDMVKQKIEEARRYPLWAKKQGIEGIARINFTVLSNGLSRDIKLVRSSGSGILDKEAIATIIRAEAFPPIPKEINSSSARMEVAIVFALN
ncbi:MAG: TonB family protein [Candidatus Omnitrophota bacterium]